MMIILPQEQKALARYMNLEQDKVTLAAKLRAMKIGI